ncbi:insulinase family protein [Shewanella woodyi]|uniref:Peptidase M16 domain protein n=1 Tax=Shewanella woodyi (strain ATCC 51908 / MS32) TaxID=392500 RepID=B1KEF1_SHEWM|nr:insulinase family protein [Shewanella woodyi]ACA86529.1 peptidase M16 domain protein [Shewanella woodyi ATCC 51908]
MSNQFQQEEVLSFHEYTATRYRHSSGLLHLDIKQQEELNPLSSQTAPQSAPESKKISTAYNAVFFIKTPSYDDSGLTHALEHLVFRRSIDFPHLSTLFQLTSLTSASINASTLDEYTCFHCTSDNRYDFELALEYLIHGILSPVITQDDLTKEVYDGNQCGVIFQELKGCERKPAHLEQMQILRGDTAPQRIHCYGGVSNTLGQLTLGSIIEYHQTHYQASKIELFTVLPDNYEIAQLHGLLDKALTRLSQSKLSAKADLSTSVAKSDASAHTSSKKGEAQTYQESPEKIYTWWLDSGYLNLILAQFDELVALVDKAGTKILAISTDFNNLQQFALRVISRPNQIQQTQESLLHYLSTQNLEPTIPDRRNPRYPEQINNIIQFHTLRNTHFKVKQCNLLEQLKQPPLSSLLAHIQSNRKQKQEHNEAPTLNASLKKVFSSVHEPLAIPSAICQGQLKHYESKTSSAVNGYCKQSKLPQPLHTLYLKLNQSKENEHSPAFNVNVTKASQAKSEEHWICSVPINDVNQLTAWLTSFVLGASSLFLQPRLNGECYSIASLYRDDTKELILYSAFDINTSSRGETVSSSLQGIAEETTFIADALTLAKRKLQMLHLAFDSDKQKELKRSLSQITDRNLVDFIRELQRLTTR